MTNTQMRSGNEAGREIWERERRACVQRERVGSERAAGSESERGKGPDEREGGA